MMRTANALKFVTCLAAWLWAASLQAGGMCDACGCHCACRKVCKLVCEMKEVTKTTYCCECEEFCVQGPSKRTCCGCDCGHCPACREQSWIPTAAYVAIRKKPVKHTEKIMKPVYKLIVEDLCPACRGH